MNQNSLNKQYYFSRGEIVLCLLTIATLSSVLLYIKTNRSTPFHIIWTIKAIIWLFWGFWFPLIFYISKKVPILNKRTFKGLLIHIPISIAVVCLHLLLYAIIIKLSPIFNEGDPSITQLFTGFFFSQFEWYFITYWSILLGSFAINYYQKFKESAVRSTQLEMQVVKAQLRALKMQLHPHFLFNMLNTITSLVRQNEKKKSIFMLSELGDLFRLVLQQKEQQLVSLDSELNFIKKYIGLEERRFKNKLKVKIEVEEGLSSALVPSFLLQPLIENSIYHGISKKIDASLLSISIKRKRETLSIGIYNDGFPLPKGFDITKVTGIGLSNTIERLSQLYRGQFHWEISNNRNGVLVQLDIPYNTDLKKWQ